ncbi:MAG: ABC transporter permease [Nocardioidaceae bacterium]|nr:ABC transporter permease [Nocardioidaceae bacterium]
MTTATGETLTTTRPGPAPHRGGVRSWAERNATILGPFAALLIMSVAFGLLAPSFATAGNLWNVLSQVSVLAVLAAGLTFVLLLGQIDLGVANIAVMTGVVVAVVYSGKPLTLPVVGDLTFGTGSVVPAVVIALVLAVALGLLAGWLTARLGIPSFIGTLGILQVAQGLAFFWSGGNNIYDLPPIATKLGGGFTGPVPNIVITAALVLVVCHVVLSRTRFGRYVYMTGANARAAELSGVPVRRVTISVFVLSAVLAAFAGVLSVGRLGSAQANAGDELLLPAIAAVVLGGTSLFGGVGSMLNTSVGLLLYGVLNNGLDQLNMNIYLKPFARGAFLLLAIAFNIVALRIASRARLQQALDDQPDDVPARGSYASGVVGPHRDLDAVAGAELGHQ